MTERSAATGSGRRPLSRIAAIALVVALVVTSGWYVLLRPEPQLRISADFATADGIFPGSRVALLGVPVGRVERTDPRGDSVRVTMSLPGDTRLPESANAYIMNPAVISDRFVELSPAHTGGPTLDDGAVIPVSRTHAPVTWDELTESLDTLLQTFGPDGKGGGGLGELVSTAAGSLGGHGPEFRAALNTLASASEVAANSTGDLGAVLDNVDTLLTVLKKHRSTIDDLTTTVTTASKDFTTQQRSITRAIGRLSRALGTLNTLLREHGDQLPGDVSRLTRLSTTLVSRKEQLAETLDTLPLALENFDRAVSDDDRLRIRLNLSTNLNQFGTTAKLCEQLPLPLCSGAGIVNPVEFPNTLGVLDLLSGGRR
ncbi:phospholipid/cholesterol/gamma-HCH transport system substrate-binding protein [Prauserella aidingensis]|uniref:MCE family protein n=1 Tax=Prauserella aidingensis TaxID=387890 RepID=UPI0020A2BA6A|nr:MCE family protein [Prauserella aidingensis]MCP2251635.1 phospholipid/cholesterol/gamma-HCH transport system substrate-binding protein [Prauserella aidingensis]